MGHDDDHHGPADDLPPAVPADGDNVVNLWRTTGYDPSGFYTAASDDQGHNDLLRVVTVPPQVASKVRALVESSAHPAYQRVGDFVRDAIVHRLAWLAERRPSPEADEIRAVIAEVVFGQAIADAARRTELFRTNVSAARDLATDLLRARDLVGLCQLAASTRSHAATSRPPFKTSYLELASTFDEMAAELRQRQGF